MIGNVSSGSWQMTQMQQMNRPDPKERFSETDVNGDSAIDMDEFLAVSEGKENSEELFSKIDSDGDGGLTETEMKAFGDEMRDNMHKMMSEVSGRMEGMRRPGGGKRPEGMQPMQQGANIQQLLEAYESENSVDEVSDEAELIEEYLQVLEAAQAAQEETSVDELSSLEYLV